jgi:hypothetical protein
MDWVTRGPVKKTTKGKKRAHRGPKITVEASDLGWKPGSYALTFFYMGHQFEHRFTETLKNDVVAWHYCAPGGAELIVFND